MSGNNWSFRTIFHLLECRDPPPPLWPHPYFYKQLQGVFLKADGGIKPTDRNQISGFLPVVLHSTQLTNPCRDQSDHRTARLQQRGTGPTRPRPRALVLTFSQRLLFESPIKGCFYWNSLAASEACSTLRQLDSFFGRVLRSSAAVCSSREETRFISSRSHRRSSRPPSTPPPFS